MPSAYCPVPLAGDICHDLSAATRQPENLTNTSLPTSTKGLCCMCDTNTASYFSFPKNDSPHTHTQSNRFLCLSAHVAALDRHPAAPFGHLDEHDTGVRPHGRESLHRLDAVSRGKDLALSKVKGTTTNQQQHEAQGLERKINGLDRGAREIRYERETPYSVCVCWGGEGGLRDTLFFLHSTMRLTDQTNASPIEITSHSLDSQKDTASLRTDRQTDRQKSVAHLSKHLSNYMPWYHPPWYLLRKHTTYGVHLHPYISHMLRFQWGVGRARLP